MCVNGLTTSRQLDQSENTSKRRSLKENALQRRSSPLCQDPGTQLPSKVLATVQTLADHGFSHTMLVLQAYRVSGDMQASTQISDEGPRGWALHS